jgi:hypothetical protein
MTGLERAAPPGFAPGSPVTWKKEGTMHSMKDGTTSLDGERSPGPSPLRGLSDPRQKPPDPRKGSPTGPPPETEPDDDEDGREGVADESRRQVDSDSFEAAYDPDNPSQL